MYVDLYTSIYKLEPEAFLNGGVRVGLTRKKSDPYSPAPAFGSAPPVAKIKTSILYPSFCPKVTDWRMRNHIWSTQFPGGIQDRSIYFRHGRQHLSHSSFLTERNDALSPHNVTLAGNSKKLIAGTATSTTTWRRCTTATTGASSRPASTRSPPTRPASSRRPSSLRWGTYRCDLNCSRLCTVSS